MTKVGICVFLLLLVKLIWLDYLEHGPHLVDASEVIYHSKINWTPVCQLLICKRGNMPETAEKTPFF